MRTTSLRAFFAIMTAKRSKSLSFLRFSIASRLCAHADLFHFSTVPSFSRYLRTTPVPAPRGRDARTKGVRVRWRKGKDWRATPVVGPSMMAYWARQKFRKTEVHKMQQLCRTRLWSMISTITAMLPSLGPDLRSTTGDCET